MGDAEGVKCNRSRAAWGLVLSNLQRDTLIILKPSYAPTMLTETHNPLVPVYLNQRIVFDLIAMLQDGIATVTKVFERTRSESSASNHLDGSFGLNKAFSSLLSINLSGKRGRAKTDETDATRDAERVHTPASLFFKLRELLDER